MSAPLAPIPKPPPRSGVLCVLSWVRTSDKRVGLVLRSSEGADLPAMAYSELDGAHPTAQDLLDAEARIAHAVHNFLWTAVGAQLALELAGEEGAESAVARVRGAQSP